MPRPRNPKQYVPCANCEKEFYVRQKWRIEASKHGVFCSVACQGAYFAKHKLAHPPLKKDDPSKTLTFACAQCGKEFQRKSYAVKPKYGPFCSHECYGKWRSGNLSGEDSPNWKGGYTMDYGGSHWKRQRKAARKRDHFICQDCGATEQNHGYEMDVHHIRAYDLFDDPEEANSLSNLVTLCRVCHAKRHTLAMA
jgi:endogenous inhibitor of DNA gyrase (YacG/DUF329 family)